MPTLYHLTISHYSEKARWALDLKRIQYRSRLLVPGVHILVVRRLAGTGTVPVLEMDDGRVVADSTDILEELDRLRPEPPLFPSGTAEGARVRKIEEFFDEECAGHVSGFLYQHVLDAPGALRRRWSAGLGRGQRVLLWLLMPALRTGLRRSRGLSERAAALHREGVFAALDRLQGWRSASAGDYLVGDRFTAADLAASCLLGPAVRPPGSPWDPEAGPRMPSGYPPPAMAEFYEEVAAHPATESLLEMWRRHR